PGLQTLECEGLDATGCSTQHHQSESHLAGATDDAIPMIDRHTDHGPTESRILRESARGEISGDCCSPTFALRRPPLRVTRGRVERATGNEPVSEAWEASVLPLY